MIVITQLTILAQNNVASLAGRDDPSIAVLNVSWLLFMLPHSILALSVATPFFTRMSAAASAGDLGSFRADLSSSLRTILLLVVGGGAAVGAAAIPLAAFFSLDPDTVVGISSVLLAYLIGLVPFSAMFVLQRAFFALADTRTPFFIQLVQGSVAVGALGVVAFVIAPARPDLVGVAVAASPSVARVLGVVLRRRLRGIDGRRVLVRLALFLAAATVAILAGVGMLALLGGFSSGFAVADRFSAFVSIALVGGTVLVVYALALLAARVPEARAGLSPLRRILGRRPR
jgi:putative peptidoglycan lipid II flippase